MSTLQSAHQYRQDSWSFNFREESEGVTSQRQKGRKAKTRRDTIYHGKCRGCLKEFECNTKDQPYCSHKCFTEHRKESKYKELQCISCLSSLGFGVKAITKRFYKVAPETVRSIIIAKKFNRSNSQQANRRLVDSTIKLSESEKNRKKLIKRIDLSLKKIKKLKELINLVIRARSNYGAGFDWRNASRCKISYWANIEESRESGRNIAKKHYRTSEKKRIKNKLRNGVKRMLRIAKRKRNTQRTELFLGTTFDDAKKRIESKFKKGMTWDNHGKIWEIDHIMPLSAFDLNREEHLKIANHISNLQPLFIFENRKKAGNIPLKHQFEMF